MSGLVNQRDNNGFSQVRSQLLPSHIPFRERPTCSVNEAVAASGLSRALLYQKMQGGEIAWMKVGARRLVMVPSLLRFLRAE
jgi:hypothetical protein